MRTAPLSETAGLASQTLHLAVEGLGCPACARSLGSALMKLPGVVRAYVHYGVRTATAQWEGSLPVERLLSEVEGLGYRVRAVARSRIAAESSARMALEEEVGALARRLIANTALSLPVLAAQPLGLSPLFALALAAVLQAWGGAPFHRTFSRCLHHRSADSHALFELATWPALVLGAGSFFYPALFPAKGAALEILALTLLAVNLGRWLELRRDLLARRPSLKLGLSVPRLSRLGGGSWRASEELAPGERVEVRAGEAFPVDARVRAGAGEAEADLYGEGSRALSPGSRARCGELLLSGRVEAEVESSQADSGLLAALEALRRSQASRAVPEALQERAVRGWMVAIVLCAVGAAGTWLLRGSGSAFAAFIFLSTLCLSCPAGLLLAEKGLAIAATGALARKGILLREPEGWMGSAEPTPVRGALELESAALALQPGADAGEALRALGLARSALRRNLAAAFLFSGLLVPLATGALYPRFLTGTWFAAATAASLAAVGLNTWRFRSSL